MRTGAIAALLVVAIVIGAGAGYLVGVSSQRLTTLVSTTTLTATYANENALVMNVGGSLYYADNVSSDMEVQNPGYAYFLNASVTFDGVKFETVCPQSYSECLAPIGNKTTQTVTVTVPPLGVYRFDMTFPDGKTETTEGFLDDASYTLALSNHVSPRAGMLIEGNGPYHAFLLVSSCGPFGCDISTTTVHSGQTP
jgi:hypothetical protein